jgi:3'(2'), 5'-bisphosphate nucleotidase
VADHEAVRPTEHAKLLADHLGDGLVAMAVVRGEADIYAHSVGQYQWDSAAP